jgi:hypothetical protein
MKKQFLVFGALLMTSAGFSQFLDSAATPPASTTASAKAIVRDGSVRIGGLTAPTEKLDVTGNIKASGNISAAGTLSTSATLTSNTNTGSDTGGLQLLNSAALGKTWTINSVQPSSGNAYAGLRFQQLSNGDVPLYIREKVSSTDLSKVFIGSQGQQPNIEPNDRLYVSGATKILGSFWTGQTSIGYSPVSAPGAITAPRAAMLEVNGTSTISGKVSIGGNAFPSSTITAYAGYKLFVQGGILTDEVRVKLSASGTWADYVFAKDYKLPSIKEVEAFIAKNNHLPNVPSAKQVQEEGINVAQMATIQQEKIEELMLYIIKQDKRIEALEAKLNNK